MANEKVILGFENRRQVTLCNHNFSREGIFHPDRVMEEYDLLFMQNGEWDIIEDDREYHLVPGSVLLLEPGKHHYSLEKCSPMMRNIYIHFRQEPGDRGDVFDTQQDSESVLHTEEVIPTNRQLSIHSATSVNLENSPPSTAWNANSNSFPNTEREAINSLLIKKEATDSATSPTNNGYELVIPKLSQTADHKEIRHTFEKVIDAFWSSDSATRPLRCSLHLEHLLLQLSELGNAVSIGKTDILISEIIHRFHIEPEHFLSPQELADNYNVSVRTISGRFKERTGMSIHQYQLQLKLDMVYDLLPLSPGRSLHDIALSFGFYDEFQFSKLFKRKFGISPSERR